MATRITPLPTPVPQSSDPANFDGRADAFLTALPTFADEANAAAEEMDEAVDTAQIAAQAALSNAGFVGRWEDQSGAAAPPYSVFHGGLFWTLLESIADVAASEPDPFNTTWAVSGAPSWYNNFAVGDYLDTARSPGAAWLRRNGAVYPKSSYPELAALMPTVPTSISFVVVDLGVGSADFQEILEFDGRLVAWTHTSDSVHVSDDHGETWTTKAIVSGARRLGRGAVFNGNLLIGMANGQYVQTDDLVAFATKSVTGFTDQLVNFAASATAVIAAGQNPTLPGATQILRRSTDLTSWAAPGVTGTIPGLDGGISYAKGMFLTRSGSYFTTAAAYSLDDGVSFTRIDGTTDTSAPTLGNASYGVREANSEIFALGTDVRGAVSSTFLPLLARVQEAGTGITALDASGLGIECSDLLYVEGKYLAFGLTAASGYATQAKYSMDAEAWTLFSLPAGQAVSAATASNGWIVTVGPNGSAMRGRFIDSDAFRVPDDNPVSGWIKATSDSAGTVGYAGVPEAPLTGGPFGRQGAAWVNLEGGDDAPYPSEGIPVSTGTAWGTSKAAPAGGLVGTTDTQTITNKTFGAGSKEVVTTGAAVAINDAAAPFQKITLTGNVTATINLSEGVSRSVWINPGAYTVTWPSGTVWAGGEAPTLPASKWSCITLTGMPSNTAGMAALVGSQA